MSMVFKAAACTLVLLAGVKGPAQVDSWRSDREVAANLMDSGIAIETDLASLWFENGALEASQMKGFSELVNRGIIDIATYLGGSRAANHKIRYFISNDVLISHSTWRSVYLPLSKVQNRTAPYLHETMHVLAP